MCSRAAVLGAAKMLQFHHKHVMRGRAWATHCNMQLRWECGTVSLRACPHHREWDPWASHGTRDASHQESLAKLYLLVTSAKRNAAQVLLLTYGVKSDLCLQICLYRHEFPNILLRDFYREEVPLVDTGLLLKKSKPFLKIFYKYRKI